MEKQGKEPKRSVPVEQSVAKEMAIEKVHTGKDIYELIRESWIAYKQAKEAPSEIVVDERLKAEILRHAQRGFVNREFPDGLSIVSWFGEDGRLRIGMQDDDAQEQFDLTAEGIPVNPLPLAALQRFPMPEPDLKPKDLELLYKIVSLIRENEQDKLPIIRMLVKTYKPKDQQELSAGAESEGGKGRKRKKTA